MEKRCFVFCIGGTGVRVMKSILMLLASGMDSKGFTVVPVCIDPHESLKAKTELNTLINDYCELYDHIIVSNGTKLGAQEGFFNTEVRRLYEIAGQQNDSSESMSDQRPFNTFLNLGNLPSDDVNNLLVQTLYSQKNLSSNLSVGFKGSPNVGSVVLGEKIKGANWFINLGNEFKAGDRIFIISSIFGGTGASGYPLLEKKIRTAQGLPLLNDALMGAVSVLPYFSLDDGSATSSDIDSKNFMTKAKSALSYYENHVLSDYLYYVGEQGMSAIYENNEATQEDKAHFVELMAATALFDFLAKDDEKPQTPQALSRAIRKEEAVLTMDSLGDDYAELVRVMANMSILQRLTDILPDEDQFPLRKTKGFDKKSFYEDSDFKKLKSYADGFIHWYNELSTNRRSFSPLNITPAGRDMEGWIKDYALDAKDESYYLLDMIKAGNKGPKQKTDNKIRMFLEFAYTAINKYTSQKLNNIEKK